jgi:hypothetical protein
VDIGAHGLVTRDTHPFAAKPSRSLILAYPRSAPREYVTAELEAAEALATAYLRAWSSADPVAVGALYAPAARLVDSLQQMDLQGRDAIAAHAGRSHATAAPLRQYTIPQGGGPAIYMIYPDGYQSALRHEFGLFVVYTADDGTGCPGRAVASLTVSAGVIGEERRFHQIDSVRRCWDTERIPPGWWTALEPLPPLPEDRVTGTVEVGGQRIEIHDGTPDLERLVRWAMRRFEAADLPAPRVASVAFGRDAHFLQCTDERSGLTIDLGDTADVYLCLTEACMDAACRSFTELARQLILHELAHAWMDRHVSDTGQQAFINHMGLEDWYRADLPWGLRGVEQAAQVIAWGLMDEPVATTRLGDLSCAHLAEAFRLMTGTMPLQTTCADPAPGVGPP